MNNQEKKKINWKGYIIAGIISLIIGALSFSLIFFNNKSYFGALNATSITAVILLSIGALSFVSSEGFFDFASYGVKQMTTMIFGRVPNAYNDYPSYREYKEKKRELSSKYYIPFLIIGALFLLSYFVLKLF